MPPDLHDRVTEWAEAQEDHPSLSEAIRRLIVRGLGAEIEEGGTPAA
jgi:hypothetical protein